MFTSSRVEKKKVRNVRYCHYALTINPQRLEQLEMILQKFHCSKISYETTTKAGTKKYDTIAALTAGDNFGKCKVIKLKVIGENQASDIVFVGYFDCFRAASIITEPEAFWCSPNDKLLTEEELIDLNYELYQFLNKVKEGYSLLSYISLSILCGYFYSFIILLWGVNHLLIFLGFGLQNYIDSLWENIRISRTFRILLVAAFPVDSFLINPLLHKYLFPSVNFLWGEENNFYLRRKQWRDYLLKGIFLTLAFSILASLIATQISNVLLP